MKSILLLSDSHSYIDNTVLKYVAQYDEVWHAGDIGNKQVSDAISVLKPFKAVWGNIDDALARKTHPKHAIFHCENVKVYMTHIGGYPNRYNKEAEAIIQKEQPNLFISGHSHILKVMKDEKYHLMHMNPGAIGKEGFHQVRTMLGFDVDGAELKNLKVIELGKK
jgi:uncharacterized protein